VSADIELTVESFGEEHPGLNPLLLVEHARVALTKYHRSPADFEFHHGDTETCSAQVHFRGPDPRSEGTLEREDFVEKGAIVLAGMLLTRFEGKRITRVVARGTHVDYFVGERPQDFRWVMEIGGTDEGGLASLRSRKRQQLQQSLYRQAPHHKDGFAAATRFAPQAASALDPVPRD
jgi:hypothetical protein